MHKNPVIQMLLRLPSVYIRPEKTSDEEKATHIIYPAVDPQPEDYARPTFRRDHVQLVLLLGIVRYVGFEHVRSAEQHTGQSAIDRGPSASWVTDPEEYFVVQHRPAGICTQPSYLESLCGVARQHQQRALHRIAVVRKQEVPTTASWPTLAKVPRPAVDSSNSFEQFNSRSSIQQIWFTGGGSGQSEVTVERVPAVLPGSEVKKSPRDEYRSQNKSISEQWCKLSETQKKTPIDERPPLWPSTAKTC
ncbi:hypothetical protein pipiens_019226 [Culex pipiens pipiens]|uniref:Uncharacterized protein n=1 Tax=Culex pipiens pipiens TaxID=38569 RepID=A0ABD1DVJ7_CULPP